MQAYVVQQGEYLVQLAGRFGFDADAVWNHKDNAPLRKTRDPHMLLPGDVLYIPESSKTWLPVTLGSQNTFSAKLIFVNVHVRFMHAGKPLAGEPYVAFGARLPPGTLDGDGYFTAKVASTVNEITLHFTKRHEHYVLRVGHLDPPETASGARQRLLALGHIAEPRGAAAKAAAGNAKGLAAQLKAGVEHFQASQQLPVTGDLDDATRKKLVEVFGR